MTRDRLSPGAGGGGGTVDDGSDLPDDINDDDGDRSFTDAFGDIAATWTGSIPFIAQLRLADSVEDAGDSLTSGDAGLGDALDAIDWSVDGSGSDATDDVTDDDAITGGVDDVIDGAGDAVDEARNLGPDWLDEATGVVLALVVVGGALFLLRPLLTVVAGVSES